MKSKEIYSLMFKKEKKKKKKKTLRIWINQMYMLKLFGI